MMDIKQQLAEELAEINTQLTIEKAFVWVDLLWSDVEATYAKAGYKYKGAQMTEQMIRQLIRSYGANLHEFIASNPKYAHFLNDERLN